MAATVGSPARRHPRRRRRWRLVERHATTLAEKDVTLLDALADANVERRPSARGPSPAEMESRARYGRIVNVSSRATVSDAVVPQSPAYTAARPA